jgi:hypothetical protein
MQHRWKLTSGLVAAALIAAGSAAFAQEPERIGDEPNLNGVWQAMNTANWNLEPHSAEPAPGDIARLAGAVAATPAGLGVVEGGQIPYLPEALEARDAYRASAPAGDPEAKCYLPGIPRATYMNLPFQIIQGGGDILFAYEYATANRVVEMDEPVVAPIDTWMGTSNGSWDGDTLVVVTTAQNGMTWLDRAGNYLTPTATVTERFTLTGPDHIAYEATIEDPAVYSEPWTISMPLYRRTEPNAQILEFKCVPFAEDLLYGDLKPEDAE